MTKKRKTNKRAKTETIKFPSDWASAFKSKSLKTNFNLSLSQPMIEFLCAVADDVMWDRALYQPDIHRPDNWIGTGQHLEKRGLVCHVRHIPEEHRKVSDALDSDDYERGSLSFYRLTPAGEAVVNLFKVVGIFVEADSAITKKGG